MNVATSPHPAARRGITVLEVLISIGILAIGLSSVLGIMAAARTQASRTVILDRAAMLAANWRADAANFGVLRAGTSCFLEWREGLAALNELTGTGHRQLLSRTIGTTMHMDRNAAAWNPSLRGDSKRIWLKAGGLYGTGGVSGKGLLGLDDVVVTPSTAAGASPDDPPVNAVSDGGRSYEGRTTAMMCITDVGPDSSLASVVTFHSRRTNLIGVGSGGPLISGTIVSGTFTMFDADRSGFRLEEIVRPGMVAWVPNTGAGGTFHQLTNASFTGSSTTAGGLRRYRLFLASDKSPAIGAGPVPVTIQFLADSVGLSEWLFQPEVPGPFTQ